MKRIFLGCALVLALLPSFGGASAQTPRHVFKVEGDHYEVLFQTGWFVESILTQTMIVHIIRTRRIPFIQSTASPFLLFTTAVVMFIGSYLPYSPLAHYFGLVPLPASFWGFMVLFILLYSVLTHNVKVWYFRKFGID